MQTRVRRAAIVVSAAILFTGCSSTAPHASVKTPSLGSTRDDPIPVGIAGTGGGWEVEVLRYNPDAEAVVARANPSNAKPKPGSRYVIVTVRATYRGAGRGDPASDIAASLVPATGSPFPPAPKTIPNDFRDLGTLANGTNAVGNLLFEVRAGQVGSVILSVETTSEGASTEPIRRFYSLFGPQG